MLVYNLKKILRRLKPGTGLYPWARTIYCWLGTQFQHISRLTIFEARSDTKEKAMWPQEIVYWLVALGKGCPLVGTVRGHLGLMFVNIDLSKVHLRWVLTHPVSRAFFCIYLSVHPIQMNTSIMLCHTWSEVLQWGSKCFILYY